MDKCCSMLPAMQCIQGGSDTEGGWDEALQEAPGANGKEDQEQGRLGRLPDHAIDPFIQENRLRAVIRNKYFQDIILTSDEELLEAIYLSWLDDIGLVYATLAVKDKQKRRDLLAEMRDLPRNLWCLYDTGKEYFTDPDFYDGLIDDCYRRAQELQRGGSEEGDLVNP